MVVDGRPIYFDRYPQKVQHFQGVTVYTPSNILNQSQVAVMLCHVKSCHDICLLGCHHVPVRGGGGGAREQGLHGHQGLPAMDIHRKSDVTEVKQISPSRVSRIVLLYNCVENYQLLVQST